MTMKTVLYEDEKEIGELEVVYLDENNNKKKEIIELLKKGLKIVEISKGGERCHPIGVLHTISSSNGSCFKLIEHISPLFFQDFSPLFGLHSICIRDNKTIVIPFGDEEIHLVAMRSRMDGKTACFWGFRVAPGLYEACLGMLNLRCLSIVFDLDETLVVANTLRSFEDRIEALQRRISGETDSQRIAGMMAEVKRYQDDKAMLKQYAESDRVVDNGIVHTIQAEVVQALSDNHQTIVRPIIRLQDKNIVLTRINPQIRDTSVLVRLRPAWEDLRNYLTAKGRKRFEVFVCTMAERDYALEMWRLLDPDSNLINTAHVLDRVVCVKSASKKSLINVFHGGICDPKMALVIDDRLKVWDEKDQPRVHVVPAFAPYYAPQAEANNAIPVLCVARNVACNVRGGFFKNFDDVILQQVHEISFEDDLKVVPSPPDVSNYLESGDNGSGSNGNKETVCFDGIADAEVERRLKETASASTSTPSLPSVPSLASVNVDPIMPIPQPAAAISIAPFRANLFPRAGPQELGLHNSSAQKGGLPESEVDADTRRRLLILQHGQDSRDIAHNEHSFPVRPPQSNFAGPIPGPLSVVGPPIPGLGPGSVLQMHSRGSWFPLEDHLSLGSLGRPVHKDYHIGPDSLHPPSPFQQRVEGFVRLDRSFPGNKRPLGEAPLINDRLRSNHFLPGHQTFQGGSVKKLKLDASLIEFAPDTYTSVVDAQVQRQFFTSPRHFSNNPAFLRHRQFNSRP